MSIEKQYFTSDFDIFYQQRFRLSLAHDAETVMAVTRLRRAAVAARTPHRKGRVIKCASTRDAHRAGWRPMRILDRRFAVVILAEPIGAPFPGIAVHVVETKAVWSKPTNWRRPSVAVMSRQERIRNLLARFLAGLVERVDGFSRNFRRSIRVCYISKTNELLRVVSAVIPAVRAGTACVLPLGLGR